MREIVLQSDSPTRGRQPVSPQHSDAQGLYFKRILPSAVGSPSAGAYSCSLVLEGNEGSDGRKNQFLRLAGPRRGFCRPGAKCETLPKNDHGGKGLESEPTHAHSAGVALGLWLWAWLRGSQPCFGLAQSSLQHDRGAAGPNLGSTVTP